MLGLSADLALYSIGFIASAITFFYLLGLIGSQVAERLEAPMISGTVVAVGIVLVTVEYLRIRSNDVCSIGLRRQTPKALGRSPGGVILWGLDTGLPFTTIRATLLPLYGVILVTIGLGGGLAAGTGYGIGFLLALWAACLAKGNGSTTDTVRWTTILLSLRPYVRVVGLVSVAVSSGILALPLLNMVR